MNGYIITADSYRKLMNEGKIDRKTAENYIRIYEFLGMCDVKDLCRMVDSSAFNDIIGAFLKMAVESADIGEELQHRVIHQLHWIFDEKSAFEVLENNK